MKTAATIQRSTYLFGGSAVATRVSGDPVPANNGLFFLHTDHLGSTSLLTNNSGQQVGDTIRYYPFGGYRTEPSTGDITDRGFTGHRHNDGLGLIYMQARYYVPGLGRFVSADSIVPEPGEPQSYNRYSYTINNPLSFTDPTGHWVCEFATSCEFTPEPAPPSWIWYLLPVEEPDSLQWYGNTEFAHENGRTYGYHTFAQGMHSGIDLVASPSEGSDIPIYAGTYGTVLCTTGDVGCGAYLPGRINIANGENILIYGHVANIQVQAGDEVTPHTIVGYIDIEEIHLHLEIMRSDDDGYYMVNPLPYFRPQLQDELLQVAADMSQNDSRISFYSPSSDTSLWRSPYDQPVLRRVPGWIFPE